VMSMDPDIQMK
jgi:hypothetical protein